MITLKLGALTLKVDPLNIKEVDSDTAQALIPDQVDEHGNSFIGCTMDFPKNLLPVGFFDARLAN